MQFTNLLKDPYFNVIISISCRYLNRRRPTGGFYDPPPMLTRSPVRTNAPPTYGTLTGSQKTT